MGRRGNPSKDASLENNRNDMPGWGGKASFYPLVVGLALNSTDVRHMSRRDVHTRLLLYVCGSL